MANQHTARRHVTATEIYCNKCASMKPFSEFHKDSSNLWGYAYYCKVCACKNSRKNWHARTEDKKAKHRQKQVEFKKARKREFVKLFGDRCFDCKQSFHDVCYDFHHLDMSTKEYNPSTATFMSMEVALKELEKCILLCANCHRMRHYKKEEERE